MDVTYRVTVGTQDLACDGLEGAVGWGRDSVDDQPAGSVCQVTVMDPFANTASSVDVGTPLEVSAVVAGVESRRFAGTLVDISVDHAAGTTTLVGTDQLGSLARVKVGDEPWPAELDGARIERILDLAGVDLDGAGPWTDAVGSWAAAVGTWRIARVPHVDGGTVTMLPRDVDRKSVLELLTQTATDAAGVFWVDRGGIFHYQDADHRPREPETTIDACVFVDDAVFTKGTAGMVNRLVLRYGDPEASVTVEDGTSSERYGLFDVSRTTDLQNGTDADAIARKIVSWRRLPRWSAPALVFDSASTLGDPDDVGWVLSATTSSPFALTGIAEPLPAGGETSYLVVEGGRDRFEGGRLQVDLVCSSLFQTRPATVWADVPAGDTWATVDQSATWLDADMLYPPGG